MKQRTRIYYTEKDKNLMWERWKQGHTMKDIALLFDRHHSSVQGIFARTGGIQPPPRRRAEIALSLAEREEISRGLATHQSIRSIAKNLSRAPSTISREIHRNGGLKAYRANTADRAAWERALRPKTCKLANNRCLIRIISKKIKMLWSPQQIAGWLKRQYPNDERFHVSHETIYKSLFIQARGVLKRELMKYLRTQRKMRQPKKVTKKGKNRGKIPDAIPISERPASVEDRAVPGHWEGDLIEGSRNTFIATLVERHTRYVMLVKVKNKNSEEIVKLLVKQARIYLDRTVVFTNTTQNHCGQITITWTVWIPLQGFFNFKKVNEYKC